MYILCVFISVYFGDTCQSRVSCLGVLFGILCIFISTNEFYLIWFEVSKIWRGGQHLAPPYYRPWARW